MTRKALGLVSALALAAAMGLSACSTTTGGSAMTPPAIAPARTRTLHRVWAGNTFD